MRGPFGRLFRRGAPAAYVETRLERLASYPPMPPPPPPLETASLPSAAHPPAVGTPAPGGSQVKLILADGSESALPADPELAARVDYLAKSMLPPRPPALDPDTPQERP